MRIAQEGGFASDEETLDPCTYRLVHMFRTMLNSKIQAGVPFNVAVLELSNTINIRQLTINNLLSEYSPEELSAIDIDLYSDWIILHLPEEYSTRQNRRAVIPLAQRISSLNRF